MYFFSLCKKTEEENRKSILELIEINPNDKIIDLGCGDGKLTFRIRDKSKAKNIYGIDIFCGSLKNLKDQGLEVYIGDLNQKLPIEDGTFDVVHANQVIEHLVETDNFVREIYRILCPGGYAIISTPNLASFHNLVSLIFGKQPFTAHVSNEILLGNSFDPQKGTRHSRSHFRIFTRESLKAIFEYYGFDVENIVGSGFYPFMPPISSILARIDALHSVYITIKVRKPE
jgi:methionine biosynthesis protein MetW